MYMYERTRSWVMGWFCSLRGLKKKDEDKKRLEQAMNDLESFVIDAQDKLSQDVYIECSTDEERETATTALSEASDWIYDYDGEQTAKVSSRRPDPCKI